MIGLEIAVQVAVAGVAVFKFSAILVSLALANVDSRFAYADFAVIAAGAAVAVGVTWQVFLHRSRLTTS